MLNVENYKRYVNIFGLSYIKKYFHRNNSTILFVVPLRGQIIFFTNTNDFYGFVYAPLIYYSLYIARRKKV